MPDEPWYANGLRFECTRCGNCCTGAPGSVRVTEEEVAALAARLELPDDSFRSRYTRVLPDGETSLIELANHDCVFWERDSGCQVYEDRPRQCRTWPFWRGNLASRAHWDSSAEGCPGMNQGPRHEAEAIATTAAEDGTSGIVPDLVEYTWPFEPEENDGTPES